LDSRQAKVIGPALVAPEADLKTKQDRRRFRGGFAMGEGWMLSAAQKQTEQERCCVIVDLREQLYGNGVWFDDNTKSSDYSPEEIAHVDAIVDGFTPEEFAAALEQARARSRTQDELDWERRLR
jgi:hypothetical protein